MKRREEIENHIGYKITKAAVEYYQANCANDVDLLDAFEAGAEWMQETMIEKTISWFYKNAHNLKYWDKDGCLLITVIMNDYRQAMEE